MLNIFGYKSYKEPAQESFIPDVIMVDYALVNLLAKSLRRQDLKVSVQNYFNRAKTMGFNLSKVRFIQEISEYPSFTLNPKQSFVYRDK